MAGDSEKVIELSGMVSALTVVRVLKPNLDAIALALDEKIARSPGLFEGSPLVIDVRALERSESDAESAARSIPRLKPPRLDALLALLRKRGLITVGVCATSAEIASQAAELGLGRFEAERAEPRRAAAAAREPKQPEERRAGNERRSQPPESAQSALMLTQPVRAGQIVYAENRDVVALAAVNPGAELIADGNVHVYATLRGRALAGARGDEQARIFCQKLEADLISIAGVYMSSEQLPEDKRGKPAQIQLQQGELVITELVPR
jgi:septum site-determining protein MinC